MLKFESFCEIREEAPNYQRNYEFFVNRFTQLCHYSEQRDQTKYDFSLSCFFYSKLYFRFRCLGLRGHHAFIRKTANDELQNDVWKYMDQIVPSIIFNMKIRDQHQSATTVAISSEDVIITNQDLAEIILKDLFDRTHLNNISVCIQPILMYEERKEFYLYSFPLSVI